MPRKQKTIHYLYKTTCLITSRYYVGMHSTSNLEDGYMGSGTRLRRSIRKHGVENHKKEILEFFDSRELLIEAEKRAITSDMIADDNCMNLKEGGYGGFISKEHQQKASSSGGAALKLKMELDLDFKEQTKKRLLINLLKSRVSGNRIYGNWLGRKHSEITKKQMSQSSKGVGVGSSNSQHGTCWITKDGLNKKIKKEEFETYISEGWVKGRNQYSHNGNKFRK